MKTPRILIAGFENRTENYRSAITLAGMEPVTGLPPSYHCSADYCDALLLPGGADIDPLFFHEKNTGSGVIDRKLDSIQLSLLDRFVKTGRPVLGICKGMQVINVYFGGGIVQHLSAADRHMWKDADQIHPVTASPDSFLAKLYGTRFVVNSAHHQGIGRPGKDLSVVLTAEDGVPEALMHLTLPIFGMQWHPERMCGAHARPDTVDGSAVFLYFKDLIIQSVF